MSMVKRWMENNHEIWFTCPKCGYEYDLRKDDFCPICGVPPTYDNDRDF